MLQKMHENIKGWIASVIIGLLCFTFVLWGIQYYVAGDHAGGRVIAYVDGNKITQPQLLKLFRQLQRQVSARGTLLNDQVNTELKQLALQNLVVETVLSLAAKKAGFLVTEDQAKQVVKHMPDFQQGGAFSAHKFQQFLNSTQLTQPEFLQELQKNILIHQVQGGIEQSDFVLPREAKHYYALTHQQRSFSYLIIPAKKFDSDVAITAQQIKTYYENNPQQFRVPEKVIIDYITVAANDTDMEKLAELSFTNPDTLKPVASALHADIQQSISFSRDGAKTGIASNPEVVASAFSHDVLQQGNNSNPITLKDGRIVVLRINTHQESSVPALADVTQEVSDSLRLQMQQAKAALLANKLEKQLKDGADGAELAQQYKMQWVVSDDVSANANSTAIPDPLLAKAFELSLTKNNNVATVAVNDGATAVVMLRKIKQLDLDTASKESQQAFLQKMQQFVGMLNYRLYVDGVRDQIKVRVDASFSGDDEKV